MTDPRVEEYLAGLADLDARVLPRVQEVRSIVAELAPEAVESFSYGLVGWKLRRKPLLYVGGFARHVGLYATPSGHEAFAAELSQYKQGKGSVQLPLDRDLPTDLVRRIVAFRVEQVAGG
ncbi:DUF1801 domain-containing protein [Nocardioides sp. GY 10127]|uniref:iron chaperone n=1 Tax=Nocardioides sp. GY 10127 TaxID=2569762 RepID=UPI0010A790A2|nr:DUF1801 domain-containing protein [Nocardioides sp. GY 10127]TIC84345.1 DUF1801 domain-containing protein [Nocardioides sp. GY 10127]